MSVLGHKRLSAATLGMSAPGKKQTFPNFIQKSIHRMSVTKGKADLNQRRRDFR